MTVLSQASRLCTSLAVVAALAGTFALMLISSAQADHSSYRYDRSYSRGYSPDGYWYSRDSRYRDYCPDYGGRRAYHHRHRDSHWRDRYDYRYSHYGDRRPLYRDRDWYDGWN